MLSEICVALHSMAIINDNSCAAPNRRSAVSGLKVERVMLQCWLYRGFDEKRKKERKKKRRNKVIHLAS